MPLDAVFAVSVPVVTLNGMPVCSVMMPLLCHLPNAPFRTAFETAKNGMS